MLMETSRWIEKEQNRWEEKWRREKVIVSERVKGRQREREIQKRGK